MDQLKLAASLWSDVSSVVTVVGGLVVAYFWVRGTLPALLRFGNGLAKRKVAVFAAPAVAEGLAALIEDTGLIPRKRIRMVTTADDIGSAEGCSVLVLHWPDFGAELPTILKQKRDRDALLVYAPAGELPIPPEDFAKLNRERCVFVTNFRGRLANDLVASLLTTGGSV